MRVGFQDELDELCEGIQAEGRLTAMAVGDATRALVDWSVEAFEATLAAESEVKVHYHETEVRVETLLARQAPVAGDLRTVLAALSGRHTTQHAWHTSQHRRHVGLWSKRL